MQLTAQLKSIEELKKLEGFIGEPVGRLNFKDNIHITSKMLNKSLIELTYNKDWKAFSDGVYEYSLDWLTNITVSDDRFEFELVINDNNLTVKNVWISEDVGIIYFKFKDKFRLDVHDANGVHIELNLLSVGTRKSKPSEATHTFQSQKALTKWIRRLIKCK